MLDQLRRNGQLTDAEYERLSTALVNPPPAARVKAAPVSSDIPWQVWVAIGIDCLGALMALRLLDRRPGFALSVIALDLLLALGLYFRNKWAYGATILVCFLSIMGSGRHPFGALINFAIGIMMLKVYYWFFPQQAGS